MANELHRMPCACGHTLADHAPNTVPVNQHCDLCDCADFHCDVESIAGEPW
jgi:hypothetical protein